MKTFGKEIGNQKDHLERHKELHKCLDELVADFLAHSDSVPSTATVLELIEWSYNQTRTLDHSHTQR